MEIISDRLPPCNQLVGRGEDICVGRELSDYWKSTVVSQDVDQKVPLDILTAQPSLYHQVTGAREAVESHIQSTISW